MRLGLFGAVEHLLSLSFANHQQRPALRQKSAETTLTSYAVVDTMSFLDERILFTASVRQQNVKMEGFDQLTGASTSDYDSDAADALFGIVVKPWQNVSFYANYAEGLNRRHDRRSRLCAIRVKYWHPISRNSRKSA